MFYINPKYRNLLIGFGDYCVSTIEVGKSYLFEKTSNVTADTVVSTLSSVSIAPVIIASRTVRAVAFKVLSHLYDKGFITQREANISLLAIESLVVAPIFEEIYTHVVPGGWFLLAFYEGYHWWRCGVDMRQRIMPTMSHFLRATYCSLPVATYLHCFVNGLVLRQCKFTETGAPQV